MHENAGGSPAPLVLPPRIGAGADYLQPPPPLAIRHNRIGRTRGAPLPPDMPPACPAVAVLALCAVLRFTRRAFRPSSAGARAPARPACGCRGLRITFARWLLLCCGFVRPRLGAPRPRPRVRFRVRSAPAPYGLAAASGVAACGRARLRFAPPRGFCSAFSFDTHSGWGSL